ncbi:MAG: hypothetical protein Q7R94_02495 [bacterium]|nr:hypothetical protein [bacterium]
MLKNMGEFFDLLLKTENRQGKSWLEDIVNESEPTDFATFRAEPFNHEHVAELCDTVSMMMAERLQGICTEELYALISKWGHQFLQDIGEVAAKEGVDFGARGTDRNITITEVAEAAGVIEVIDGRVRPKQSDPEEE